MLEKFDNALLTNHDILFYNADFDKVTFIANQRHILAVDDLDENDRDTIIHVRLLAWCSKSKICKALKKFKQRTNASSVAS